MRMVGSGAGRQRLARPPLAHSTGRHAGLEEDHSTSVNGSYVCCTHTQVSVVIVRMASPGLNLPCTSLRLSFESHGTVDPCVTRTHTAFGPSMVISTETALVALTSPENSPTESKYIDASSQRGNLLRASSNARRVTIDSLWPTLGQVNAMFRWLQCSIERVVPIFPLGVRSVPRTSDRRLPMACEQSRHGSRIGRLYALDEWLRRQELHLARTERRDHSKSRPDTRRVRKRACEEYPSSPLDSNRLPSSA